MQTSSSINAIITIAAAAAAAIVTDAKNGTLALNASSDAVLVTICSAVVVTGLRVVGVYILGRWSPILVLHRVRVLQGCRSTGVLHVPYCWRYYHCCYGMEALCTHTVQCCTTTSKVLAQLHIY
jgi:hypothetical protein